MPQGRNKKFLSEKGVGGRGMGLLFDASQRTRQDCCAVETQKLFGEWINKWMGTGLFSLGDRVDLLLLFDES